MIYFSLDIETSTLEKHQNNILSLGIVCEDSQKQKPLKELPVLHLLFLHDLYSTSEYAMKLNDKILRARNGDQDCLKEGEYTHIVKDWAEATPIIEQFVKTHNEGKRATVAGKNVANFDFGFLPEQVKSLFRHRMIDPGSMFARSEDEMLPDTKECCIRAGINSEVAHTAVADAHQVIELVRVAFSRQEHIAKAPSFFDRLISFVNNLIGKK